MASKEEMALPDNVVIKQEPLSQISGESLTQDPQLSGGTCDDKLPGMREGEIVGISLGAQEPGIGINANDEEQDQEKVGISLGAQEPGIGIDQNDEEQDQEKDILGDELSDTLFEVVNKRMRLPRKANRLEEKILKNHQSEAEQTTVVSNRRVNKVVVRYPVAENVVKTLQREEDTMNPGGMLTRARALIKRQPGLIDGVKDQKKKK